jgi:hypothetical protein
VYAERFYFVAEVLSEARLVVNTTSAGLAGSAELDIDWRAAREDAVVTDIVYAPLMTPFLKSAAARGLVAVDGLRGRVVVSPSEEKLGTLRGQAERYRAVTRGLWELRDEPAVTRCGTPIELLANIELAIEAHIALEHGAQGVVMTLTERPEDDPAVTCLTRLWAPVACSDRNKCSLTGSRDRRTPGPTRTRTGSGSSSSTAERDVSPSTTRIRAWMSTCLGRVTRRRSTSGWRTTTRRSGSTSRIRASSARPGCSVPSSGSRAVSRASGR